MLEKFNLKIYVNFSHSHINATLYAVFLLPVDLLCFHISVDYIFIQQDAVFFFRHQLAVLLSLKEIVVGGPSYLITDLECSLLKTHFTTLSTTFIEGHYFFTRSLIAFISAQVILTVFSAFAPLSSLFRVTVWVVRLQGFKAFNTESAPITRYGGLSF